MNRGLGGVAVLVVAKAPVPGLAKTRVAADTGDATAAQLAAAALLDTLHTVIAVAEERAWPVVVALTGDLDDAAHADEIRTLLGQDGLIVVPQRGDGLDERLAHAHVDAAAASGVRGIIQVGMDTPQLTRGDYVAAVEAVQAGDRVLGPADDGGWWLLGLPDAADATALIGVPMSTDQTAEHTARALDITVRLRTVRDMDSWADAQHIADDAPDSRLAAVVGEARSTGIDS
ncbi:TIGR04282 family arsenosugar biosynthesis glycosyltransferase [Aeromicrobium sp. CF3.5]|uniref:TIGR04282 family arsenosugar biosynthesis glycosyltransferase n=1 Tax=Aeromicrobium sp. CF3.5 TaxID=3373078 RepID=UPI003EE7D576